MTKRKHQKPLAVDMDFTEALERFAQTDPSEVRADIAKGIKEQRVRLVGREDNAYPLLIYTTDKGRPAVELPFKDGTLWATQKQMADMFGVQVPAVSKHLKNIFDDAELVADSVVSNMETTAADGKRYDTKFYNLNAIISVGYRIESTVGTMFRIWATDILVQILTKGFFVDVDRMKNAGEPSVLDEFKKTAREIRTSIRNSYREVLKLCTLCSDYDGSSEAARAFFMAMENKLLWASANKTAPQLILERADADKADMGLTYYAGKRGPTKADVLVGNNYLAPGEAEKKNRATEMWLTYVEEQLDQGRLPTMAAVAEKLDGFIKFNQWPMLNGRGHVSRDAADDHALEQLELYRARKRAEAESDKARSPKKLVKKS